MSYQIYTAGGSYADRIAYFASKGCAFHLQFHANSGGGSYSLAEVNRLAAGSRLQNCMQDMTNAAAKLYGGVVAKPVNVLDPGERGHVCLGETIPGALTELFFCDNRAEASMMRQVEFQDKLAQVIVDSIKAHYADGTKIGLSLGHVGNRAGDEGAPLYPDGTPNDGDDYEAEIMGKVMQLVINKLNDVVPTPTEATNWFHVLVPVSDTAVIEKVKAECAKRWLDCKQLGLGALLIHASNLKVDSICAFLKTLGLSGYTFDATRDAYQILKGLYSLMWRAPYYWYLIKGENSTVKAIAARLGLSTYEFGSTGWIMFHCRDERVSQVIAELKANGFGDLDGYKLPTNWTYGNSHIGRF